MSSVFSFKPFTWVCSDDIEDVLVEILVVLFAILVVLVAISDMISFKLVSNWVSLVCNDVTFVFNVFMLFVNVVF